jgi:hypothetical protein
MATLSPDQRNYYYLLESERTGIHKPILAALYQIHSSPSLSDGQTGLGISPAKPDALLEGVRIWRGLDTKEAAIASLVPDDKVTAASEDAFCLLEWTLDPWWLGGLARFINFPNLCHIDARSYRTRWLN